MATKPVTAIEINESHIKVLQTLGGKVVSFWVEEILEQDEKKIAVQLGKLMALRKFKTGPLLTSIPRRMTMLRVVSLPSHDEKELAKMVNLQVVRQAPYSPQDIVSDFSLLEKETSGYSKVQVVIVHKDVIMRFLQIFSRASLAVQRLTLSSMGLLYWYLHWQRQRRQRDNVPVAVIQVDSINSE